MNINPSLYIGLSLLILCLILSIFWTEPKGFQEFIFKILLSLSVGFLSSGLIGSIELNIGPNKNAVSATGGIALFLFVYLTNPRKFIESKTLKKIIITDKKDPKYSQHIKNLEFHNSLLITIFIISLLFNLSLIIIALNLLPQPFYLGTINYSAKTEQVSGTINNQWTNIITMFTGEKRLFIGVTERTNNLHNENIEFPYQSKIETFSHNFQSSQKIVVKVPKEYMLKIYKNKSRYGVCLFSTPKGHIPKNNFSTSNDNKITKLQGCLHNTLYKENLEDT